MDGSPGDAVGFCYFRQAHTGCDDIFDMYAAVLLNGFTPDTMLVHPMAWLMWVKDPVLREFAIQAGGGSFFANFTGNPAQLGNKFYN
jgi:hypothetical protein